MKAPEKGPGSHTPIPENPSEPEDLSIVDDAALAISDQLTADAKNALPDVSLDDASSLSPVSLLNEYEDDDVSGDVIGMVLK